MQAGGGNVIGKDEPLTPPQDQSTNFAQVGLSSCCTCFSAPSAYCGLTALPARAHAQEQAHEKCRYLASPDDDVLAEVLYIHVNATAAMGLHGCACLCAQG